MKPGSKLGHGFGDTPQTVRFLNASNVTFTPSGGGKPIGLGEVIGIEEVAPVTPELDHRPLAPMTGSVRGRFLVSKSMFRRFLDGLVGRSSVLKTERRLPLRRSGMPALKARVLARIATRNEARRERAVEKRAGKRAVPTYWF